MAFITAETRSSIVELAMGMLNQAPSTELLTTLIGKSTEGASLQDLADYIATTDAFTAEYPATQTAREFATEMFGKLITGGTLDADINTAVIDLLEGLLIAGTTKAEGFVAVINFLADSASADHPDLGDIAQSFQNRADAAEYFSITKELGGSTDAELAAAIASVTSDADTLTAANAAADETAGAAAAEEDVAGQTFTLTTGIDEFTGNGADNTFNAPAVNETTGAATTTITSGDTIDGGAGDDTLNITVTASNNTSLSGLSVKNVEVVNISGADYLGAGQGALASATKAAAAATAANSAAAAITSSLAAKLQAEVVLTAAEVGLTVQEDALNALDAVSKTGQLQELLAAADAVNKSIGVNAANANATATQAELTALTKLTDAQFTAVGGIGEDGLFTKAQMNAVISLMASSLNGVPVADDVQNASNALSTRAIAVRQGILDAAATMAVAENTETGVDGLENAFADLEGAFSAPAGTSTVEDTAVILKGMTSATAAQIKAAYAAVEADAAGPVIPTALTSAATPTGYTVIQYNAALTAAKTALAGSAALTAAEVLTRAGVLSDSADVAASLATAVAANTYTSAQLQSALTAVTTDTSGATLFVKAGTPAAPADNSAEIAARAVMLDEVFTQAQSLAPGVYTDAALGLKDGAGNALVSTVLTQTPITLADVKTAAAATPRTDVDDTGTIAESLTALKVSVLSQLKSAQADQAATTLAAQAANVALAAAESAVSTATVVASGFAGAEQVWLSGASGETAVSAGAAQIIGFSGVTMDNAVTTAAASPTFAISASKGDLEVKGAAATSINFIGSGGTVAPSLTTTKTNEILSVTSSTTGTLTLDLTSLTDLETATANGTGALSLQNSPNTLATITTGAGADVMEVTTKTAEDDEDTDEIETVSAVVSTGAGNDTIVVNTSDAGTTSIDAGEGDDTVVLVSKSNDTTSIALGEGSDTFRMGQMSTVSTKTTVSGGAGVDTLVSDEATWSSADYLILNTYVSGFEKLVVNGSGATIDASELSGFVSIDFKNGDGTVTDVNGQTLLLSSREEADEVEEIGLAAVTESTGDDLTATALGYDNSDPDAIEFGADLNVVVTGNGAAAVLTGGNNALALNGNNATVSTFVAPLGDSLSIANAVISGDIVTLTANMSSLAMASKGAALNYTSYLNVTVTATELENLETITVRGAGSATINGGNALEDDAVLTKIDVSGMSKQLQVDGEGKETATNQSTTSITGNANASEEILLGGAKDVIVLSGSTAGAMDVVSGFTLVALKSDSESVNRALSDDITTASTFVFDEDANYGSLTEAVLELGSVAGGHIFHADGNTYLFDNIGVGTEYEDTDLLIELTGTFDLTLLADLVNP